MCVRRGRRHVNHGIVGCAFEALFGILFFLHRGFWERSVKIMALCNEKKRYRVELNAMEHRYTIYSLLSHRHELKEH